MPPRSKNELSPVSWSTNINSILLEIDVKKSAVFTVLRFEPKTFRIWISSHNH